MAFAAPSGTVHAQRPSELFSAPEPFPTPRYEVLRTPGENPAVPRSTILNSVEDASLYEPGTYEPGDDWTWQCLPDGLIYRSYLAGAKEPRFASRWNYEENLGWIWDIALGGRVAIFRYGTEDSLRPEGWEVDIEGAGLPRLDMEHGRELVSADFRFGIPITYGTRTWQTKFAYYHLSSHLGDEFMIRYPTVQRINFARDVLVLGGSYFLNDDVRLYSEAGFATYSDGGSEPWEFQMGLDYSPAGPTGRCGAPFFAVNGHLREEVDFGGNFVVQAGWQWRGPSGHLFRVGVEHFNGKSDQFEFFNQSEQKTGVALWYDY